MGAASDDELDFEEEPPSSPPPEVQEFQSASPRANTFAGPGNTRGSNNNELLQFANACSEEFGLADSLKEDVLRCAKLPMQFFLIRMYARISAVSQQVQQSTVASFLESADFKEHITRRLQAGLLDPNILHYVQGTTARFVRHMTENPASYKIPEAVQLHFMHSKPFSSAVGSILSNTRGEMKRKIQKSITEKQDIYTLCQKLAIRGFQLSEDHAQMLSFVRMYLVEYNNIQFGANELRPSFWAFVDTKLDKYRKKSKAAQARSLEKNFGEDKKQFTVPKSTGPSLPAVVHVPQWQTDIGIAVLAMSSYQIDASAEQDDEREQVPAPDAFAADMGAPTGPSDDGEPEEGEGEEEPDANAGGGAGNFEDNAGGASDDGGLGDQSPPPPPPAPGHVSMDLDNRPSRPQGDTGPGALPSAQRQSGPMRTTSSNGGAPRASPLGTPTSRKKSLRPRGGKTVAAADTPASTPAGTPASSSRALSTQPGTILGTGMATVGWPS